MEGLLFRRLTKADGLTPDLMSDRAVTRLVQAKALAAGYNPQRFAAQRSLHHALARLTCS